MQARLGEIIFDSVVWATFAAGVALAVSLAGSLSFAAFFGIATITGVLS